MKKSGFPVFCFVQGRSRNCIAFRVIQSLPDKETLTPTLNKRWGCGVCGSGVGKTKYRLMKRIRLGNQGTRKVVSQDVFTSYLFTLILHYQSTKPPSVILEKATKQAGLKHRVHRKQNANVLSCFHSWNLVKPARCLNSFSFCHMCRGIACTHFIGVRMSRHIQLLFFCRREGNYLN